MAMFSRRRRAMIVLPCSSLSFHAFSTAKIPAMAIDDVLMSRKQQPAGAHRRVHHGIVRRRPHHIPRPRRSARAA